MQNEIVRSGNTECYYLIGFYASFDVMQNEIVRVQSYMMEVCEVTAQSMIIYYKSIISIQGGKVVVPKSSLFHYKWFKPAHSTVQETYN